MAKDYWAEDGENLEPSPEEKPTTSRRKAKAAKRKAAAPVLAAVEEPHIEAAFVGPVVERQTVAASEVPLNGPLVRPNDPRPQVEIYTTGGEVPGRRGAYTDQELTTLNADQVSDLVPVPFFQQALGGTGVYNPPEFQGSDFSAQPVKPHAPMAWRMGRDPYKNDGMVGQDFFKHGGS